MVFFSRKNVLIENIVNGCKIENKQSIFLNTLHKNKKRSIWGYSIGRGLSKGCSINRKSIGLLIKKYYMEILNRPSIDRRPTRSGS